MKKLIMLLAVVALGSTVSAALIPIVNGDFEDPAMGIGGYSAGANGWTTYTGAVDTYNNNAGTAGAQVGIINAFSGCVYQPLAATIEADTVYTLSMDVFIQSPVSPGWDPAQAYVYLALQSQSGGDLATVGAIGNHASVDGFATDTWYTITCEFDSSTDPSRVGQGLQVLTWDANVFIDNIQLDAVPEPATMAILGLGGLLIRRKRA